MDKSLTAVRAALNALTAWGYVERVRLRGTTQRVYRLTASGAAKLAHERLREHQQSPVLPCG